MRSEQDGSDPEDRDHEAVARTILLDQLATRARSRAELADKLRSRQIPDEVACDLLDRFTDVGLIDDSAFARSWVESRQRSKGLAGRALAMELRRKGIDEETAREALDEIDPALEADQARLLVQRRIRSMERLTPEAKARRLVGMLARKGYGTSLAWRIVRDELGSDMPESDL